MHAKQVIKNQLDTSTGILMSLLGDLSDADMLVRPVVGANHTAWQLGHLINSEAHMISELPGAKMVELPADFSTNHGKETAGKDSADGFLTKDGYIALYKTVRAATLATLEQVPDADLDRVNTGRSASYAPKIADLLMLPASHVLMHIGQFSVVRRKLGKPIVF